MVEFLANLPVWVWILILWGLSCGLVYVGYCVGLEVGEDRGYKKARYVQKKAQEYTERGRHVYGQD